MIRIPLAVLSILIAAIPASAAQYHVSTTGHERNVGSNAQPFKTISAAAHRAQPGDTITVHEGIYRERVNPPRGGTSDDNRIVYQAAPGAKVVITGSEVVSGWTKIKDDTWMVKLPNSFFGDFNPFNDLIEGHWFQAKDRTHHTGAVYVNGDWLTEAATLEEVLSPTGDSPLWFGQVDDQYTTLHAQFPKVTPSEELIEVNARQTVFYPSQPGLNYITVRGFTLTQAATPWAPPTVEQIGLIGTHWSQGWIIENNIISHSVCAGLTLGLKDMGVYMGNLRGYTKMIQYAMAEGGWSKENVGHHLVRGNRISNCEQAGICGSLGGAFSRIENNEVFDIHVRRIFHGQEQGGIKLHGAIDTVISGNAVHGTPRALWLDWMGQGAVISENLAYDNNTDLYLEVNHGPALVANNLFLSGHNLSNKSRGTAFVHNLFAGQSTLSDTTRITPYLEPHSTSVAGEHGNAPGDDRYYNNIYAGYSLTEGFPTKSFTRGEYANPDQLPVIEGNLFIRGAQPYKAAVSPALFPEVWPDLSLIHKADGIYIEWISQSAWQKKNRKLVTTDLLGKAGVSGARYEHADGSAIQVDTDYFGKPRNKENPMPGPFELPDGLTQLKVWPRQ